MKTESRTPLTLCEACTLMARETVSLLDGIGDTLKSATTEPFPKKRTEKTEKKQSE